MAPKKNIGFKAQNRDAINEEDDRSDDNARNRTELTRVDAELCKQNFQFYDK